eukprot:SAG31_NODE_303_length_18065_cov_5.733107_24_plen_134_part_00
MAAEPAASLKWRSHELTGKPKDVDEESWLKRIGTRAFVRMGGWAVDDFDKPVITVAAPYTNASSCNHQFDQLAKAIADAVEAEGGKPYICHPPVITDGMTMGAEGMKYSLPSRDMIAVREHYGRVGSTHEILL